MSSTTEASSSPLPSSIQKQQKKMFYTTSDLMTTMNNVLKEECPNSQIELQRRLPDGTTRRANNEDLATADLQAKIQQAAKQTSHLTLEKRLQWSEAQRQNGNILFHDQEYREAMDVYLTCLVGMRTEDEIEVREQIQLPVLLNLSLCAMKLGMYKKAITFGDMTCSLKNGQSLPKAYFRRGKAKMLSGRHGDAKTDFDTALHLLQTDNGNTIANCKDQLEAVKKEMNKLEYLERKALENQEKCRKAMKVVIGGESSSSSQDSSSRQMKQSDQGLYRDIRQRRTHSNIRARSSSNNTKNKEEEDRIVLEKIKKDDESSVIYLVLSLVTRCLRWVFPSQER